MIRIRGIEFFTFEEDVWYRKPDGGQHKLTEHDETVRELHGFISEFYPAALAKLEERFKKFSSNIVYYRYKIVRMFCKCNFGLIDNVPDIDACGLVHFEHVPCPMRGDCPFENIVCHPKFNSQISEAEMRVLELLHRCTPRDEIAVQLCLSPHTVNNHIKNAYQRIGVHKDAEFIVYASKHNLFKVE